MKKLLTMFAFGWAVILIALYFYTDLTMPSVNQNSDYLMTFYTAGDLVKSGKAADLYPPANSSTFVDTAFDKAAHAILPKLPAAATAEYMYMPAVASFFIPFSMLDSGQSLIAWQLVSLAALATCTILFSARNFKQDDRSGLSPSAFWVAMTLIPLAVSIWIGQVSIVFGVLPFMLGLFLALKRKDLPAGLILALTVIKPQFFVPTLIIGASMALAKRYQVIIGIVCGAALFLVLNVALFSTGMIEQWLATLKLADTVYSDVRFGVAQHMATSLPRAIILLVPVAQHAIVKPLVYIMAMVLGAFGFYKCVQVMKSKLPEQNKLALTGIIAIFATPVIVPHLFFYDYAIFVAAGYLIYAVSWSADVSWRLKSCLWLGWIITNIYGVVVLANKKIAMPLIFVLLMLELYRRILVAAGAAIKESPDAANPLPETT